MKILSDERPGCLVVGPRWYWSVGEVFDHDNRKWIIAVVDERGAGVAVRREKMCPWDYDPDIPEPRKGDEPIAGQMELI